VATLGDRLLPAILTHSPDLAARLDSSCLGELDTLPVAERDALIDTVQAWFDADGDVRRTAEIVFCHRNTVHNRLRRIESLTGLSTDNPTDIALLYLSLLTRQLGLVRTGSRLLSP
jgi:DNA-binding PucR family transcriptional regulator